MLRRGAKLLSAATVVATASATVVSCGDSASPPVDIVGTYSLQAVDGRSIPDTARGPSDTTILETETFTARADLTFEVTTQYILTHGGQTFPATGKTRGIYSQTGRNTFAFTPQQSAPPPSTGVLDGNTLTVTYPTSPHVYVYKR